MNTGPVLVDVAVKDLSGLALDWAVAKADGVRLDPEPRVFKGVPCVMHETYRAVPYKPYRPSTDWSQGGPLIDKYQMDLTFERKGLVYSYQCKDDGQALLDSDDCFGSYGATHLIAVCRAIVAARFGETVHVPASLVTP